MLKNIQGQTAEELIFNWSKQDLNDFAKELNIKNRSRMNKAQLAMSIEDEMKMENMRMEMKMQCEQESNRVETMEPEAPEADETRVITFSYTLSDGKEEKLQEIAYSADEAMDIIKREEDYGYKMESVKRLADIPEHERTNFVKLTLMFDKYLDRENELDERGALCFIMGMMQGFTQRGDEAIYADNLVKWMEKGFKNHSKGTVNQ